MYCSVSDVVRTQPLLTAAPEQIDFEAAIAEASQIAASDLDSVLDVAVIDFEVNSGGKPPAKLRQLTRYKAREIAYSVYYGGKASDTSEISLNRDMYNELLEQIRDDRENGLLDDRLIRLSTVGSFFC